MKILLVHNRYQYIGGEDNVVAAEAKLLADNGCEVEYWSVDNKDLQGGLSGKLKTALATGYSQASKVTALEKLRNFCPDVVHVHNFFPQISPSIYDACAEMQVPVVQTLHNYRLICPGALLMREGKICELCINGSPYQSIRYGCYRGSKLGSLVVANMVDRHRKLGTWHNKVSHFIALTEFAKAKFIQAGFPVDKMTVKANFVSESPDILEKEQQSPFALFVGRLSQEKGINTLAKAWRQLDGNFTLKVAGSGDPTGQLSGSNAVELLGFQNSNTIAKLMQQADFLVMPSESYETFGMVLIEAFAHRLPVLASRLGSMEEIVKDGETGLLFEAGNPQDLAEKAQWMVNHPNERRRMGDNAHATYLSNYTPEINYLQLMAIYRRVTEIDL